MINEQSYYVRGGARSLSLLSFYQQGELAYGKRRRDRRRRGGSLCCCIVVVGQARSLVTLVAVAVGEEEGPPVLGDVVGVVGAAFDPGHGGVELVFVAALGDGVEEVVGGHEDVEAAGVGGVRMKDLAVLVLVEDGHAGGLGHGRGLRAEVVEEGLVVDLGLREADAEVLGEVGGGRDPGERPAQFLLVRFQLRGRGRRGDDEGHVARGEVRRTAVVHIGQIAAALAALVPVLAEHEMNDDQLRLVSEEVLQRHLRAVLLLKRVLLLDLHPRHLLAPQLRDLVPLPRQRLLLFQQLQPLLHPPTADSQ
mmetsp:Transcript_22696/g.69768  ORF Transcript_22696/g.69768 Transcript_22696/m.69768 type:complete len:308 (+) Transcript_22696:57-980(+)